LEILLKIGITLIILVLVYYQLTFLKWTWSSHIDVKATFSRILKQASPSTKVIVTRDPNKIYQNGEHVGNVVGAVKKEKDCFIFNQIIDTSKLNRSIPFEYKREKYQIIKIQKISGLKLEASRTGSDVKRNVIEGVICRKVK